MASSGCGAHKVRRRHSPRACARWKRRPHIDLPVIDAHQHFWDLGLGRVPWLCDAPPIAFRYGDYAAIRRDYLPGDYARDLGALRLAGSVFVETEWDRADPVGETRWVHALAAAHGLPSAMVCHVALDRADAAEVMAAQAGFPLVRGVRHKPRAGDRPGAVRAGEAGTMDDAGWRAGYARLTGHALSFDLQTPWWHLEEAARLATDFPATPLILNHTGLPADRSAEGLAGWRRAMERLAGAPNAAVKISGLGERGRRWEAERNAPIILDTIRIFGEDRCMFASNFPVDRLVGDLATIHAGFDAATRALGRAVQAKLFAGNARRVYRLGDAA